MEQDVEFDFDGALRLAARMHALADLLAEQTRQRERHADQAMAKWSGPKAHEFRAAAAHDAIAMRAYIRNLHRTAYSWAQAWAHAWNQQNQRNYERLLNHAATQPRVTGPTEPMQIIGMMVFEQPDPVRIPTGPAYHPTATRFYES